MKNLFKNKVPTVILCLCIMVYGCFCVKIDAAAVAKKYTIVYNANGGTGKMSNTVVTYGKNTQLRANSFTRTGYSFTGWYAYRKSDKKWCCINKSNGSKKWLTASQVSNNSSYKKYLYKNKTLVSKTTPVNNDTVTMYAQWKQNIYKKAGRDTIKRLMAMNDHGYTAISLYYSYSDEYVMNSKQVTYKHRRLYFYAKSSRAQWDNPYNVTCGNIYYMNSSGRILKTFKMNRVKDSIYPTNVFAFSEKENSDRVTYNRNNSNKGAFLLSITGQYCLNPYATTITYSLKA